MFVPGIDICVNSQRYDIVSCPGQHCLPTAMTSRFSQGNLASYVR